MTEASKPAKKAATTRATARKTTAPQAAAAAATKRVTEKAPAKKAVTKRSVAKKAAAQRVVAKKTAAKSPVAKATPRGVAAKKAPAKRAKRPVAPAVAQDEIVDAQLAVQDENAGADAAGTPHRPSRRHLIVDAAIRVFARKGFSEASIQEIADDAGVVATAVYYHFAGKEELFEAALTRGLDASDAVIAAARPDDAPADASIFRSVIRASWNWAEASPDMARLLFLHMPGGATPVARTLARDYLERHARRAYDYFENTPIPTNRRRAAAEYAARTLTVRTVMGLTLSVHSLQMEGGPLSSVSSAKMVDATARLCERLFQGS